MNDKTQKSVHIMADIHHFQKKEGSVVSDQMRYIPKPITVRLENLVMSIKASNGSLFSGDGSTQVIFYIWSMSGGYCLDSAATWMSIKLVIKSINATAVTAVQKSLISH